MERKNSVDLLRVISAIAIIIIHIVSAPLTNRNGEIEGYLINNLNTVHNLMNWAVPVFFMITGYCLLQKTQVTYKYCFTHVLKYICVLFTVGLSYVIMEEIFSAGTIKISFLEPFRDVISGNLWDHMWFVYDIIGVYLVMPIIYHFLQRGNKDILILTTILFLFNILFPIIEEFVSIKFDIPMDGYLFYVCFGGAVAKCKIDKKVNIGACFLLLISVIYIIFCADGKQLGYKNLVVCIMAISIFVIAVAMEIKSNKMLLCFSKCTWGIYLIHPFFINIVIKLMKIDLLRSYAYVKLMLFAVIVTVISFGSTYILRKIPIVKKLF